METGPDGVPGCCGAGAGANGVPCCCDTAPLLDVEGPAAEGNALDVATYIQVRSVGSHNCLLLALWTP